MENVKYIEELFLALDQQEKVNPYAVVELKSELESEEVSIQEVERLCFLIVSNLYDDRPLSELQDSTKIMLWYDYIRLQLYLFFSGHGEYHNNSILLSSVSAIVVDDIVEDVVLHFGVDNKLIPLVISLLVCVIAKVTVSAWCDHFYHQVIKDNLDMQEYVKKLRENK